MEFGYAAADLVVARAGATTIAELQVTGKASLLVPLPTSADDHQRRNAEAMREAGASVMLLDSELGSRLRDEVVSLVKDNARLRQMGEHAKSLANPDADRTIAEHVVALARTRHS
jgi:UDP-N-acetylglucosamine--N-acetylmuramyl-(pentapeptide) pyrophosphoryl-undecaprenol N-acetylglucosamine transferase